MSFQPVLNEAVSLGAEMKIQLSHKDFFVDPDRTVIDDSHIHSCYEIYVNVSGDVSFLHGDRIYSIKPGDVIFSFPGEVHYCIFRSPCIHDHYCLWFEPDTQSYVTEFLDKYGIDGHIRLSEKNKKKLISIFCEMEKNKDFLERSVLFGNILMLLREKEDLLYDGGASVPEKLRKILEYINESFSEISSVSAIADKFHVSIPTVNRWFREHLYLPPTEFIRAKKLSYAEKLIREDCSVTEACFLAGFSDCSRFIMLFKKNYGKTPLQYKKALRYTANEN